MKRLALATLLLAGCASLRPQVDHLGTSDAPQTPWAAPADVTPPPRTAAEPPAGTPSFKPGATLSLADVVDAALSNNPTTRAAWLRARVAQEQVGIARSAYLPEVDGSVIAARQRGETTLTPALSLGYLLFDFGGRAADVEQARQALIAADFEHNQAIQDIVLDAEEAYYGYLDAKALLDAQDATLKERATALEAAEARHRAGVATIADVLQARTARAQAQLNRETFEGNLRTFEGLLATVMGLPASMRFDFGTLPAEVPARQTNEAVEALLARALERRPELAAARAEAERANARIRAVESAYRPSVGISSSVGRAIAIGGGTSTTPYSAAIALRVPIFTGGRNRHDVRAAQLEAALARENVRSAEQRVGFDVWSSYFALQTAEQRVATARELLSSAQQSVDVAAGRYRSGVGTILDLLTAEAALESARAQEVQARTDWFLSLARLAHDTGTLAR